MSNKLSLIVSFVAMDKMSGALRNIIGLGRQGSTSLKGLNGEAKRLERQMAGVQRELKGATGNVTALMNRERELAGAIAAVNTQIARQQALSGIDADRRAMLNRAGALKGKGMDNMMGGASLSLPLILAGKAAMDFSSGMVDIQQKAQLTNAETAKMAANILALSKAAHQLPEDMRSGVDALAGLGLDPRQAVQMIGPIGRLGTAFKVDLADGANAAFSNLNNLKVPIGETAKALDIMAASGNAGAFEVRDMARWFPTLTAQAQALGQKGTGAVADLAAALQIARRGAGDADQAANNLQNLLVKINSPATIAKFQKLGIDLPTALKKAYAEGKTPLEAIAELTKKATGGDLAKIGFVFEDMQAQAALRTLIQNMDDYRKIRAQVAASGGTVDQAFAQREAQDAAVKWRDFLSAAQRFGIVMGRTVLPAGTAFLTMAANMADRIGAWASAHPRLANALGTLVTLSITARIGLGALQFAFGGLLGPLAKVWSLFARARVLGTVALWVGRLGFLLVSMAGWWVLAGIAIGAFAAYVITHWGTISATFWKGVASVKGALSGLPGWLKSIGSLMMEGLLTALDPSRLVAHLLNVARMGVTAFKNYFGIKSPSRLMMQMGGHIATGLGVGIDRQAHRPAAAMRRLQGGLTPMAPAASRPAASGMLAGATITIPIYPGAGQSAEEIADAVMRRLERAGAKRARSSYDGAR
jgi:TP901 family phage tail tape measure protein